MPKPSAVRAAPQGFGQFQSERLPILPREAMTDAQMVAADAIINGPRKAIFGPFVPLLRTPGIMQQVGRLGETLRFEGTLSDRIRELVICVVARATGNQFEWQTHVPLAIKAGVAVSAIEVISDGRRPKDLALDEDSAIEFVNELLAHQGVCDNTYAEAVSQFGETGTVELTTLVGYFVMVCWVMNVARTPGPSESITPPLLPFPR